MRAVNEERGLDGYSDEELLALAAADDRVLIMFNARETSRGSAGNGWKLGGRMQAARSWSPSTTASSDSSKNGSGQCSPRDQILRAGGITPASWREVPRLSVSAPERASSLGDRLSVYLGDALEHDPAIEHFEGSLSGRGAHAGSQVVAAQYLVDGRAQWLGVPRRDDKTG